MLPAGRRAWRPQRRTAGGRSPTPPSPRPRCPPTCRCRRRRPGRPGDVRRAHQDQSLRLDLPSQCGEASRDPRAQDRGVRRDARPSGNAAPAEGQAYGHVLRVADDGRCTDCRRNRSGQSRRSGHGRTGTTEPVTAPPSPTSVLPPPAVRRRPRPSSSMRPQAHRRSAQASSVRGTSGIRRASTRAHSARSGSQASPRPAARSCVCTTTSSTPIAADAEASAAPNEWCPRVPCSLDAPSRRAAHPWPTDGEQPCRSGLGHHPDGVRLATGPVGLGPQRQVVGVAGSAELRGVVEEIVGDVLGGLPAVPLEVTGAHRPVSPGSGLQGIQSGGATAA